MVLLPIKIKTKIKIKDIAGSPSSGSENGCAVSPFVGFGVGRGVGIVVGGENGFGV